MWTVPSTIFGNMSPSRQTTLDPLSDILSAMRVSRARTFRFESNRPYSLHFPEGQHLTYGAVVSGSFELCPDGIPSVRVSAGDCYLLTDDTAYITRTAEVPPVDGKCFFEAHRRKSGIIRHGDGEPELVVIGGRFSLDDVGAEWLRLALPLLIHIPAGSPEGVPLRATLAVLRHEAGSGSIGEKLVVARIAQILFVQALRAHLVLHGEQERSWLAGLTDPRLGRALRAFHAAIAEDWTIARLAAEAGMSRSSFAEHFRRRSGLTPMDYVARWRLFRIRRALLEDNRPFAVAAADNGWQSRTSCSRAFRALFGASPQQLRAHETTTEGRRNGRQHLPLPV
ncbi:AraC family transcriptional regulator [Bradyrhizobium lablabi]|uniref:AraC family transcriptional regulator n=1 Tax=Bradyrhizobium lablabi TaxID=722472 RepID=UPI002011CD8E|nr:AraC family transcriptional regulator [Bradyrhizobium lablabi]